VKSFVRIRPWSALWNPTPEDTRRERMTTAEIEAEQKRRRSNDHTVQMPDDYGTQPGVTYVGD
jgi:hypothetical protein